MFWSTILYLLNKVLDYYAYLANLFMFLYKNFSFPLLFLIVVFLFRKEISDLLKRIKRINLQNNSGEVSFHFSELLDTSSEFDPELDFMERQYGEAYDPHFGSGSGTNDEYDYYLSLIYAGGKLNKELSKNGPFKTIENLHDAYFYLTKDKNLINDRPTQVIEKFYYNAMELQDAGGYIPREDLIYKYSYFIKTSLNLVNKRINKEQKKETDVSDDQHEEIDE
ncbi:hypothetical protein KSE1242_23100 (plasmid) [Staphylococcus epidermidis]|uniref:hypothetical protein n=1 Tax=Staphylococcus epidermidis TaxID=1282 RepID=UPI002B3E44A5|nr:hypothetical protein [Staphylococcus epidermidis]HEQ3959373.1 hypothetical protein [Streptococcus pyogenes]